MVEMKAWKIMRGLAQSFTFKLCSEQKEIKEHLLSGCKVMSRSDYLAKLQSSFSFCVVAAL